MSLNQDYRLLDPQDVEALVAVQPDWSYTWERKSGPGGELTDITASLGQKIKVTRSH